MHEPIQIPAADAGAVRVGPLAALSGGVGWLIATLGAIGDSPNVVPILCALVTASAPVILNRLNARDARAREARAWAQEQDREARAWAQEQARNRHSATYAENVALRRENEALVARVAGFEVLAGGPGPAASLVVTTAGEPR